MPILQLLSSRDCYQTSSKSSQEIVTSTCRTTDRADPIETSDESALVRLQPTSGYNLDCCWILGARKTLLRVRGLATPPCYQASASRRKNASSSSSYHVVDFFGEMASLSGSVIGLQSILLQSPRVGESTAESPRPNAAVSVKSKRGEP